ncbi:MAG: hypothetical protein V4689_02380 [Verrucomicrobiota bacterium]
MKHLLSLLMALSIPALAETAVRVGEVSDKRTTGEFFSGLEIKLLVSGPELADAKGLRVKIDSATDDTGKSLIKTDKRSMFADKFEPLKEPFGPGKKQKGEFEIGIDLANPPRTAKTVAIIGKLEVMSPNADPTSVVTASVAKVAGTPLDEPTLKAAGVEITFKAPKGDEFSYELKDPESKVATVEFCSADGKPLKSNGSSSMGFGKSKNVSVTLTNPPADVTAKIYLITAKSVIILPIKLDAITLP